MKTAIQRELGTFNTETVDIEYSRYEEFERKHFDCGAYTKVEFSFTGIGTGVDVICGGCGAREDLTAYEVW